MLFRDVHVSRHAVFRMLTRYVNWDDSADIHIVRQIKALIAEGAPVGGQYGHGLVVQCTLNDEPLYFAGRTIGQTFLIQTVLSRDQIVSNMSIRGQTDPNKIRKHHRSLGHGRRFRRHMLALREGRADESPRPRRSLPPPPPFDPDDWADS